MITDASVEPEAGAAVLLRDQRGEPAGLGQRIDERFGIAALLVDLAEVLVGNCAHSARTASRMSWCRRVFMASFESRG